MHPLHLTNSMFPDGNVHATNHTDHVGNVHPTNHTIPNGTEGNVLPKHSNIHTEKRKYRGTNILLYFIFSICLLSMCIRSSLIIKPGIEIRYDSVDPYSYNDRVETVLSNLPSSVIWELSENSVEINIVSGVGFSRNDVNGYVYQRIPGSTEGTGSPEGLGTPCTPSVPQDNEGYVLGCYVCNTQQIYIFIDNIENSGYEYQSLEGTLVHEIGHFIWYHILQNCLR